MSTHKRIDWICVAVLVVTLLLTVLFINGEALGIQKIVDEDSAESSDSAYFTKSDLNGDWDTAKATVITLNRSSVKVSGSGAYAYDGGVVISGGGYYVISGELTDGSITVDAYSTSKVWILLDGVTVNCSDDACLIVDQAKKVFLTLAAEYSDAALADNTDGVIFAHDDLTINGSGSLTVTAAYKHGIVANDDLVITGGTITVEAAADGIRANDSLRICGAALTVDAGDDGIVTSNEDAYLYVESGSLHITAADDAIHTAGDITVAGGSLTITAGDDGIHSDTAFAMSDGSILVEDCYEGIEAITIDISGGEITLYPSDDGLNANGGSGDFMGMMSGMGGQRPDEQDASTQTLPALTEDTDADADETWVHISGGTITIVNDRAQDADGIDSNGDIVISGGVIRVSLAANGSNSALDYGSENGGVCEISGGEVIACGSYAMAEGFDATSTQCSILYNLSDGAAAGTTVALEDLDGNVLLSYEVPCSFSSVNLSSPALTLGESYRVVIGDQVEEITLSEIAASYGDAKSGGFGGTMNWGGMQQRGDGDSAEGGSGFGGFGGFGGRRRGEDTGTPPDFGGGEAPDMGAMPTPPDGELPDMSEMPSPPDGAMPTMGERPEMPDGEAPDMGGQRPDQERSDADDSAATEAAEPVVYAEGTWRIFALSAAALVLALAFAGIFKRRG